MRTDLLQKLIALEQSARKIGSTHEANAVALRIGRFVCDGKVVLATEIQAASPKTAHHARRTDQTSYSRPEWHHQPATMRQRAAVERLYKSVPENLTKAQASRMIEDFFAERSE